MRSCRRLTSVPSSCASKLTWTRSKVGDPPSTHHKYVRKFGLSTASNSPAIQMTDRSGISFAILYRPPTRKSISADRHRTPLGPHHFSSSAGSVHALNTRPGGAGITRRIVKLSSLSLLFVSHTVNYLLGCLSLNRCGNSRPTHPVSAPRRPHSVQASCWHIAMAMR